MAMITECGDLSLAQIEYFKSSKMRNPDGTLEVFYHGTEHDFDQFSSDFIKSEPGFWFADYRSCALQYGAKLLSVHLKITNPFLYLGFSNNLLTTYYDDCFVGEGYSHSRVFSFKFRDYLIKLGYDGIVYPLRGSTIAIAFYPEQIKSIDNRYPTNTPFIHN